jgi:ribulose-5-phosphate 4-epimerase/fuculose-1-phosphate aldolase
MLETICETMVEAYRRNWITSRDGNVSIRHHDRDHFYITPSGVRKQTLQPDQFKRIGITTGINSGVGQGIYWHLWRELEYTDISSSLKPSGEIPLHFGLQKEMGKHKNDVRVVMHFHPTYCVAAMHAGIDLSSMVKDFPELSRYTKVAPNVGDVPPISQELADQCFEKLELDSQGNIQYDIVGIKGHGVVAIDTSPWRAFEHIERLEHICQIVLASRQIQQSKSVDSIACVDASRSSSKIKAEDFGVPPEFAERAENYAQWSIAKAKEFYVKLASTGIDPRPATDPEKYLPGARAAAEAVAKGIAACIRESKLT